MTTDPIQRLPGVFGSLIQKSRLERKWTLERCSNATGLSVTDLKSMEEGKREPTLTEFFRIASAIHSAPGILMVDLTADWRGDLIQDPRYKSRPSDFSRVYRLGFYHDAGDFREHGSTYDSIDQATGAARKLNPGRRRKSLRPLNTICIYVRMEYLSFDWEANHSGDS